ncbi:MAG: hypothetical protein FWG69_00130 [Oscillospiraceae bacterium]|nr:hypothetical protein [Oscillospiraceae bacterium]
MDEKERKYRDDLIALKKLKQGQGENVFENPDDVYKIVPPKTFKEKWKHYCYYYALATLGAVTAVVLLTFFISETFFRDKYDLTVVVAAETYLDAKELRYRDVLTRKIEENAADYDGDGKTNILLDIIPFGVEIQKSAAGRANSSDIMFTASLTSSSDILYILDDSKYKFIKERKPDFFVDVDGKDRFLLEQTALKDVISCKCARGAADECSPQIEELVEKLKKELTISARDLRTEEKSEKGKKEYRDHLGFFFKIINTENIDSKEDDLSR